MKSGSDIHGAMDRVLSRDDLASTVGGDAGPDPFGTSNPKPIVYKLVNDPKNPTIQFWGVTPNVQTPQNYTGPLTPEIQNFIITSLYL
jgi:hypothetical protein